jgi:hypothetical protein
MVGGNGFICRLYKPTASTSFISAKESDCARVGSASAGALKRASQGLLPDLTLSLTIS